MTSRSKRNFRYNDITIPLAKRKKLEVNLAALDQIYITLKLILFINTLNGNIFIWESYKLYSYAYSLFDIGVDFYLFATYHFKKHSSQYCILKFQGIIIQNICLLTTLEFQKDCLLRHLSTFTGVIFF